MSYEEAALVPLTDELRGSLRKITPKGCVIRYVIRTDSVQIALFFHISNIMITFILMSIFNSVSYVSRDQARAMRTTGSLMSQDRRKRKTFEKPHGSKNIKWFAKYKYV